jgi:hypothetical protein
MPLPSSGSISAGQINSELSRSFSNSMSLNESSVRSLAGKSSGTISYSDLLGKSSVPPAVTITCPTGTFYNINLRNYVVSTGLWNQTSPVIVVFPAGCIILASSNANPALIIDGSWPGGLTLEPSGWIFGGGGNGGGAGSGAGHQGGIAIQLNLVITINATDSSIISGGGGGGGGGGSGDSYPGGGGGGGAPFGITDQGAYAGVRGGSRQIWSGGTNATLTAQGRAGYNYEMGYTGYGTDRFGSGGGDGGYLGQPGSNGSPAYRFGGGGRGGAAGPAFILFYGAYVIWKKAGNVWGTVVAG